MWIPENETPFIEDISFQVGPYTVVVVFICQLYEIRHLMMSSIFNKQVKNKIKWQKERVPILLDLTNVKLPL